MSDLTDPLWGTGYGSKRHLVEVGTRRVHEHRSLAVARCGQWLAFFADTTDRKPFGGAKTEAEYVASREPCATCQKIADREAQS